MCLTRIFDSHYLLLYEFKYIYDNMFNSGIKYMSGVCIYIYIYIIRGIKLGSKIIVWTERTVLQHIILETSILALAVQN